MLLNYVAGFNASCGTSSGENFLLAQFESLFPEGIVHMLEDIVPFQLGAAPLTLEPHGNH